MVRDEETRLVRVPLHEGTEDLAVLSQDGILVEVLCLDTEPAAALKIDADELEPAPDLLLAGDIVELLVEQVIGIEEDTAVLGIARRLPFCKEFVKLCQVLRIKTRTGFDADLRLETLADIAGALDRFKADLRDIGAALRHGLDKTLLSEPHERFTYRRASESEICAEVLHLQLVARCILCIDNAGTNGLICLDLHALILLACHRLRFLPVSSLI